MFNFSALSTAVRYVAVGGRPYLDPQAAANLGPGSDPYNYSFTFFPELASLPQTGEAVIGALRERVVRRGGDPFSTGLTLVEMASAKLREQSVASEAEADARVDGWLSAASSIAAAGGAAIGPYLAYIKGAIAVWRSIVGWLGGNDDDEEQEQRIQNLVQQTTASAFPPLWNVFERAGAASTETLGNVIYAHLLRMQALSGSDASNVRRWWALVGLYLHDPEIEPIFRAPLGGEAYAHDGQVMQVGAVVAHHYRLPIDAFCVALWNRKAGWQSRPDLWMDYNGICGNALEVQYAALCNEAFRLAEHIRATTPRATYGGHDFTSALRVVAVAPPPVTAGEPYDPVGVAAAEAGKTGEASLLPIVAGVTVAGVGVTLLVSSAARAFVARLFR